MAKGGLESRIIRLQRLAERLRQIWIHWRGTSGQIYFEHRVAEYERMWRAVAEALGAEFHPLSREIWEIRRGDARSRIATYQLEFDNPVILRMAGDKPLMHRMLSDAGLPVPDHQVFTLDSLANAYRFLDKHPLACVVKPAGGYGGRGVTTHLVTAEGIKKAAILASLHSRQLLIERQIPGECYRLLVLEGRVVHAVCRLGQRLRGDGHSTIGQLLGKQDGQSGDPRRLLDDADVRFTLGYQNLALDSVPEEGREFLVRSVNDPHRKNIELRTVYTETVTERIGRGIVQQAEQAATILGSDLLGVDIIATDVSQPLNGQNGVINEVNTTPALHHHYNVEREKYPDVALKAMSALLSRSARA
jgi:cyanophycin synthetase